jgi:hypothetical protein
VADLLDQGAAVDLVTLLANLLANLDWGFVASLVLDDSKLPSADFLTVLSELGGTLLVGLVLAKSGSGFSTG